MPIKFSVQNTMITLQSMSNNEKHAQSQSCQSIYIGYAVQQPCNLKFCPQNNTAFPDIAMARIISTISLASIKQFPLINWQDNHERRKDDFYTTCKVRP
jgi:hypothetical protein